ncbi:MAG TPA: hypothetical protein VIK14_07305 [Ignavibacteria bacterium]
MQNLNSLIISFMSCRELTKEEIEIAKKGLEYGLLTGIDSVYGAIFNEMIPDIHRNFPLEGLSHEATHP